MLRCSINIIAYYPVMASMPQLQSANRKQLKNLYNVTHSSGLRLLLLPCLSLALLAACSKDDAEKSLTPVTRAQADSTAAAASDVLSLHLDTAWADTIHGTFDDYEVTTIDASNIGDDGDAAQAMSRKR